METIKMRLRKYDLGFFQKFWADYYRQGYHRFKFSELYKFLTKSLCMLRSEYEIGSLSDGFLYNGGKILDAGCGPGTSFELLFELFSPNLVIAGDITKEMIDEASLRKDMMGPEGKKIEVRFLDLTKKLPFPDDFFNVVWSHLVIYYLPFVGWDFFIREASRVLVPGGQLYITTFLEGFNWPAAIRPQLEKEKRGEVREWMINILPTVKKFQRLVEDGVIILPRRDNLFFSLKSAGFEILKVLPCWQEFGIALLAEKRTNKRR